MWSKDFKCFPHRKKMVQSSAQTLVSIEFWLRSCPRLGVVRLGVARLEVWNNKIDLLTSMMNYPIVISLWLTKLGLAALLRLVRLGGLCSGRSLELLISFTGVLLSVEFERSILFRQHTKTTVHISYSWKYYVPLDPSFDIWKMDPTLSMFWHVKCFNNRNIFKYVIDNIISIILI